MNNRLETIIDTETTRTILEHKKDGSPSPYLPTNKLVSVQTGGLTTPPSFFTFNHSEFNGGHKNFSMVQEILDKTTLLIGHNLKFDLAWLRECGFKYNGEIWDTQIFEYLAAKGQAHRIMPSLNSSAERRGLEVSKLDILSEYWKKGINTDSIPLKELEEYALRDIDVTRELYKAQKKLLEEDADIAFMLPAIKMRNEFLPVLVDMERAGISIDLEELNRLDVEYTKELNDILQGLRRTIREYTGDKPYNIASPEQLSQIVYGYRFKDREAKKKWQEIFGIGSEMRGGVRKKKYPKRLRPSEVRDAIELCMSPFEVTEAEQCDSCHGIGHYYRKKKDGTNYNRPTKCKKCDAVGIYYRPTGKRAGFCLTNPGSYYATVNGFAVDKNAIEVLLERAAEKKRVTPKAQAAVDFLTGLMRVGSIENYKSSFIDGIRVNVVQGLLHPTFNQCATATTRLSSTNPNCFSYDTEVLTSDGWKYWPDVTQNDKLGQWELDTLNITFEQPLNLIRYYFEGSLVNLRKSAAIKNRAIDILCTKDHNFFLQNRKNYKWTSVSADKYLKDSFQPQAGFYNNTGQKWSKSEIILYCAVQADGHIRKQDGICEFTLKKERKIKRLLGALKKLEIPHTKHTRKDGSLRIYIPRYAVPSWFEKEFSIARIMSFPLDTLDLFAKEVFLWDGSIRDLSQYCSISKNNADTVQIACTLTGSTAKVRKYKNKYYIVDRTDKLGNLTSNMEHIETPYAEYVYCATMPNGTLITRRNGVVAFAGNCQNMPRANTFPVRKVVKSRWEGGYILSADVAQFEFRAAAFLSQCEKAIQFIKDKKDIHSVSAEFYGIDRQQAKAKTFRPLYMGKDDYAEHFYGYFPGIKKWQNELLNTAVRDKEIRTATGLIYAFPGAERLGPDKVRFETQICNYPVQGFATGDVMPLVLIYMHRRINDLGLRSKLILTVHDDITADVHPDEKDVMTQLFIESFNKIPELVEKYFGIILNIPVDFDVSIGYNWMDKEKIYDSSKQLLAN